MASDFPSALDELRKLLIMKFKELLCAPEKFTQVPIDFSDPLSVNAAFRLSDRRRPASLYFVHLRAERWPSAYRYRDLQKLWRFFHYFSKTVCTKRDSVGVLSLLQHSHGSEVHARELIAVLRQRVENLALAWREINQVSGWVATVARWISHCHYDSFVVSRPGPKLALR